MATQSILATTLRGLHIPGKPLILTNIYDAVSAQAVAALSGTQALATASFAVAAAAGVSDDEMTLETNLAAVRCIAPVAAKHGLPLTVDWQDGYGDRLEEGVEKLLDLGVVGVNLEDYDKVAQNMYSVEEATSRVRRAMAVAEKHGIADFVINARADVLLHDGLISEAIARGTSYLAAGATTVFILGGAARGGVTKDEIEQLTRAFHGKLNVAMKLDQAKITAKDLANIGVARISIGPSLQLASMKKLAEYAEKLLLSR